MSVVAGINRQSVATFGSNMTNGHSFGKNLQTAEPSCSKGCYLSDVPSCYLRNNLLVGNLKQPLNNTANKVSFTSNPLYNVALKKKATDGLKHIGAVVSELSIKSPEDIVALNLIDNSWDKIGKQAKGKDYSVFSNHIIRSFASPKIESGYYAVEIAGNHKSLGNRIVTLMQTTSLKNQKNKDKFTVYYLQTNPSIVFSNEKPVKGGGELALYGAVKQAKAHGFGCVNLYSTNDSFYEKMGFKHIESKTSKEFGPNSGEEYQLHSSEFDSFIDGIEKKYGFNNL